MKKVNVLQNDLQQVRKELLCPKQVTKCLEELRISITKEPGELRYGYIGVKRTTVMNTFDCIIVIVFTVLFYYFGEIQKMQWNKQMGLGETMILYLIG